MRTTLDIAALVEALALPLVLLVAIVLFREPIVGVLKEVPRRIESISIGGVSIRLAEAKAGSFLSVGGRVDIRGAGRSTDVSDSTQRSFYEQISNPARIDYAVVDLESGQAWLSSRLYILSIILRRMRGMRAIVFVADEGTTRRRFVGVCPAEAVRWRLAARWPLLESAIAAAELQAWGHPYGLYGRAIATPIPIAGIPDAPAAIPPFVDDLTILNDEGRLKRRLPPGFPEPGPPDGAIDLLTAFLEAIQRQQPMAGPPGQPIEKDWIVLPGSNPVTTEFAVWLERGIVEELFDGPLDQSSITERDLQSWSDEVRTRAVLEHRGDWIAITRDGYVFDRLIDRREALDLAVRTP